MKTRKKRKDLTALVAMILALGGVTLHAMAASTLRRPNVAMASADLRVVGGLKLSEPISIHRNCNFCISGPQP